MESRASRALLACAVFVAGALAVVGPSAANAAGPKLDNGIGTQAALSNPNCDPETKEIKILLIARAPVREGRARRQERRKHRAGRHRDSVKVVIVVEEDPTKPPTTPGGIGIAGKNQATGAAGTLADDAKYESEMLAHFYETYGRKLDIEFYVRSGARRVGAARRRAGDRGEEAVRGAERVGDHGRRVGAEEDHHVRRAERPEGHRAPGAVPVVVVDGLLRDDPAGRGSSGQAGVGRQGEVGGRRVDARQDPQVRHHLPGQRRRPAVPRPRGVRTDR